MISLLYNDIFYWLVIPMLFGSAAYLLRGVLARRPEAMPDDRSEKLMLLIMVLPFVFGIFIVPLVSSLPVPITELAEIDDAAVTFGAQAEETAAFAWQLGVWPLLLGVMGIYGAIALMRMTQLIRSFRCLLRQERQAEPVALGQDVRVSDGLGTPLATLSGHVLVPRHFAEELTSDELGMILTHERAHVRRGDPLYFALLGLIDAVFWGHPLMRRQTQRCRLAAELACDEAVCVQSEGHRKAYASLIVKALQHTAGQTALLAPAVFAARTQGECGMRISRIMRPSRHGRALSKRALLALAAATFVPLATLQWAVAESGVRVEFTVSPLKKGIVSSAFGQRKDPLTGEVKTHRGMDIAAPEGVPVRAPARGVVSRVRESDRGYGNVVEITHADGVVTRYAQLQSIKVTVGDEVRAGDAIAKVGSSGRSTGPHLHLEMYIDGELQNPADHIPLPATR